MPRQGARSSLLLVASAIVALCAARPLADDAPAASHEDAFVRIDASASQWSIGNSHIELDLGFDPSKNLIVEQLWNPGTGQALDVDQAPDSSVTIGSDRLLLNQSSDKLSFISAASEETDAGVKLVLTFEHRVTHTLIRRAYACYPGSPTLETWTRLELPPRSPPIEISSLVAWQFTMPAGPIRWINGLRGDSAGAPGLADDPFGIGGGELDDGDETTIGSNGRSSESFVPAVMIDNDNQTFFGGVIWSGAWRTVLHRTGDRMSVSTTFPDIATSLSSDHALEFPHSFFGHTDRTMVSESAALRQFVMRGIRRGRPLEPLVTYNTWYPYGTDINEDNIRAEMQYAAALGVELFVLDAGWWPGAGAEGSGDFSSGLGSWEVDGDRFPSQLAELADEAHALGMKFGLWVEPERIALSTANQPGLAREQWLATSNGSYGTDGRTAQLCFGSALARKWVLSEIAKVLDAVQPDYLKWDNNFWINCNRAGHDHGSSDGNFAHVMGLYAVLDQVRQRYPNMLIENVSGGGNRLDYGMMAYSDAGWMDDLTSPSAHVRHNFEGLSIAFPPAYLLSFVIDSEEEPLEGADLPQIVRSRMPGILGLTYRGSDLNPELSLGLATEIARYKLLRDTITQSSASLLGTQAPTEQDGWDVVQEVSDDGRSGIIFAFKGDAEEGRLIVRPRNLLPDTTYEVRSVDNGMMGEALGADLIRDGVELVHSGDGSRAHVIVLTAVDAASNGLARRRP